MVAKRVNQIEPFMVMEILELAKRLEREGQDVIHLEIGEPDFKTPAPVCEEACAAIGQEFTHYTPSRGWSPLRDRISQYLNQSRGLTYDPDTEIMVSAGSSPAFLLALGTLLDPGDGVVITNPCYSCYPNFVKFFDGVVQDVAVFEDKGFALDPDDLNERIDGKTRAVILNSPANPTGEIIPRELLRGLADIVEDRDLWVLSDEIYASINYEPDGQCPSILDIPGMKDHTILLDGFSKFYAMTGWRLGYICAPADLMAVMDKIQQNFIICAPSISQVAGFKALDPAIDPHTQEMLETYRARREVIVKGLNEIPGISCRNPRGAFYAFANIKDLGIDSKNFCRDLLLEQYVATTPGIAFGSNGEGFVRFSYANNVTNIERALDRVRAFVEKKYT